MITSIFDLEDDVKMELGYIGDYYEYNGPAKRLADELEHRTWERQPWVQKGSARPYEEFER